MNIPRRTLLPAVLTIHMALAIEESAESNQNSGKQRIAKLTEELNSLAPKHPESTKHQEDK